MSLPKLRTWVSGETITAAQFNKEIRENFEALRAEKIEKPVDKGFLAGILGCFFVATEVKRPVNRRAFLFPWKRGSNED